MNVNKVKFISIELVGIKIVGMNGLVKQELVKEISDIKQLIHY